MNSYATKHWSWRLSLVWVILCSATLLFAQTTQHRIDSLRIVYSQTFGASFPPDTTAFSLLFTIGYELTDVTPDSSIIFGRQALQIAQNLRDSARIGRALFILGYGYKNSGNFALAMESHRTGVKAAESGRDTMYLLRNINGLGLCFMAQKNYQAAQLYFYDLLHLSEKYNSVKMRRTALNNLGYILWRLGKYDSALVFHKQSYQLAQSLRDTLGIGISYINFGVCYQGKRDFSLALDYLTKALVVHERLGNIRNIMLAKYYLGGTLHDMNNNQAALPYLEEALRIASAQNMHSALPEGYGILADTYQALGNSAAAVQTLKSYTALKDSLFSTENSKQIAAMLAAYENEKKDKEIRLLQEEHERSTQEKILFVGSTLMLLIFLIVLTYLNRQKSRANKEITRQKSILEEQASEIELANTKLHENYLQLHELNASIEQKITELEAIDAIVQSINSEVELQLLLPKLLEQGHILIPSAEKSSILMLEEEAGHYRFIAFRGYNPDWFTHLRFSPEETRIRYIQTKPVEEGVYILTEYAFEIENGAKFTNEPPQCSLVMTISLDKSDNDLPNGILFFDSYSSRNAFTSLDIQRVQRFRKHVITAFAKAKVVKAKHDIAIRLSEQNQRLQDLDREKNEFLGIAAHDMKSPLAGIMASVGMLKRFSSRISGEEAQKILLGIEQTTKRMSEIITNLLDINAIESGKMNLTPKLIPITDIIRETLEQHRERATAKNITLLFHVAELSLSIVADAGAIAQVFDNLVSNAIKYSPAHSCVIVHQEILNQTVRVSVKDEGVGLSEQDLKKMFRKFARLSAKPTGGEDSTGLGLSIVKRLTEAMHGRVWCESELGKGSTFFVELPM